MCAGLTVRQQHCIRPRARCGAGTDADRDASGAGGGAGEKSDAASLWNTLGFKISGYVDISYVQNFNNPNTNVTNMRIFDTQANSFVPQLFRAHAGKTCRCGRALAWSGRAFARG